MSSELAALERRASQYRDYPEDFKAAVIAAIEANNGNVLATSKLFNLPQDTVYYWWRNSDRFCEIQKASAGLTLADKLESLANANVDSLTHHDLELVTYADKTRGLAVIIDKMQLLRSQPTQITQTNVDTDNLTLVLQQVLVDLTLIDSDT